MEQAGAGVEGLQYINVALCNPVYESRDSVAQPLRGLGDHVELLPPPPPASFIIYNNCLIM